MQRHRFDPKDPNYEGGKPTVMPPISDPNHPDHAKWSEEQVYGNAVAVADRTGEDAHGSLSTASLAPGEKPERTPAKKAAKKRRAAKAAAKKRAAAKK